MYVTSYKAVQVSCACRAETKTFRESADWEVAAE
jgi:hypothetical protein